METVELEVEARAGRGKGASRKLRQDGKIPAVVYAGGRDGLSVSFAHDTFVKAMRSAAGRNARFRLKGGGEADGRVVIAREIQKSAVGRKLLHVDLYELDPATPIVVSVPVVLVGTAPGTKAGGVLRQLRRRIDVRCLPEAIPAALELSVDHLELGEGIDVSQVVAGEGVEVSYRHKFAICRILIPRGLADEAAAAVAEAKAGGEEGKE